MANDNSLPRMPHSTAARWLRVAAVLAFSMILACGLALADATVAGNLEIVRSGRSSYEIITNPSGNESARKGATELQRLILKSTGVKLPLTSSPSPGYKYIVVGANPLAAAAGITPNGLPSDGFHLRITGGNIYLVGHDDSKQEFYTLNNNQSASAGSYFAVIEFAKRYLHARWYMPGPLGEELPRLGTVVVPASLDVTMHPFFAIRFLDITSRKTQADEQRWRASGDISGDYYDPVAAQETYKWGRHLRLGNDFQLNVEHSWYRWVPAETPNAYSPQAYGKSHPEYFAVPGGKNRKYYYGSDNAHGGQLCTCNPEVAKVFAQNIIVYARKTGEHAFSLSPNDGDWECKCACCRSWDTTANADGYPDLTDHILDFSNRIAGLVSARIPDVRFGLYAYHWTLEPPIAVNVDPRIDISDVYNGFAYRFHLPVDRSVMEQRMRGWRQHAANVVLTTYYTFEGNYSLPWSTIDTQAWLVKFLARYPSSAGIRMNYTAFDFPPIGMVGPDPWILSQLLWDPHQSVTDLENEYYRGAFGPKAGPLIRRYFDLINASMVQAIRNHPYEGVNGVRRYIIPTYAPIRADCRKLIDEAMLAVANNPKRYRWRVDRIARGWRLAELTLDAMQAEQRGSTEDAIRYARARRALAVDRASVFALAPASMDYMDKHYPLGLGHDVSGLPFTTLRKSIQKLLP